MERSPISMDNYIDFSNYLSTGIRRTAFLAPQVELGTTPRSAIPKPIVFVPPKNPQTPAYYPSYLLYGERPDICTYRQFVRGDCSSWVAFSGTTNFLDWFFKKQKFFQVSDVEMDIFLFFSRIQKRHNASQEAQFEEACGSYGQGSVDPLQE